MLDTRVLYLNLILYTSLPSVPWIHDMSGWEMTSYQAIPLKSICWHLPELLALMPAAGFSFPTNVDFHKCRHIQMSPHLSGYIHPQSHNSLVKIVSMIIKNHSNTHNYGQNCQNVSVDNVLSNPHHNNGVSKVLGILLSDFVSRGSKCSL